MPNVLHRVIKAAAIMAAGLWIYLPVLNGGWLWDDSVEITQNEAIKKPVNEFLKIWTSPAGADYFPLKTSLQWIEWHVFGENPFGYHCVSLFLHLASALLIWIILDSLKIKYGWLAGLVFVIHPVAVDSVAWISELKNTLSLPFLLLAWYEFINEEKNSKNHILSLFYFVAALLSKSSVVMFPITAVIYLFWKNNKISTKEIKKITPLFLASGIISVITIYFQYTRAIAGGELLIGTWIERTVASASSICFYIKQAVFPFSVSPIYPKWSIELLSPNIIYSWLCILSLAFIAYKYRLKLGRGFFFLGSIFIINLIPALGIVPMSYLRYSWVSDHFEYISLVALGIIVASLWTRIINYIRNKSYSAAQITNALGFSILVYLSVLSHAEAARYAMPETFWSYNLEKNPNSWIVNYNFAEIISQTPSRHEEAISYYKKSIKLNANDPEAHNNLGILLGEIQSYRSEALIEFETAIRMKPDYAEAYNDLAALLAQDPNEINSSIENYLKALELKPDLAQAHNNIANLYKKQGLFNKALGHYEHAIRLNPKYAEAENNWANMLVQEGGHDDEAITHYYAAVKLSPNSATIHFNLGLMLERIPGKKGEALNEFETVLKLVPNYQPAIDQINRLR
jgi:tetratricopeptide (TPR) repeat protein